MLPHAFIRVEVRRVGGQPLQLHELRPAGCQKSFDFVAPVNRRPVPHHQQFASDHAMHMPQEADTFNARQGSSPRQSIKLSARCDPTHHRQVVAGLEGTQDRSCGTRGIGANHSGQQVETRFVNEDGRAMLPPRFFFNSAQVSSRHSVIFSSLRWAARSLGFGGVQCKAFKRRDTWSLWYETANSRRMTCATRAAVQTSPRKPYASAPCDNNSGSWSRCCAVNFDAAPVCGRAARLSSPPVETLGHPLADRALSDT